MFETELQVAERHLREGEDRLARLYDLRDFLKKRGHPTEHAEMCIANLEDALVIYRQSVARHRSDRPKSNFRA